MNPQAWPTLPSTTIRPPFMATPQRGPASPRTWMVPPRSEAPTLMAASPSTVMRPLAIASPAPPPRVAGHGDGGAIVEAAAVVAHRAVEGHLAAGGQGDAEVVPRQRALGHPNVFAGLYGGADLGVDLAQGTIAGPDQPALPDHAAIPAATGAAAGQMRTTDGPSWTSTSISCL